MNESIIKGCNEAQERYLKEVLEYKLDGALKEEWENINLFLLEFDISVLPDGYCKDGKYLNYGDVRRLYDGWWELKSQKK